MSNSDDNPSNTLPAPYGAWIGAVLSGSIPQETKATCHDCAMCTKAGPDADPSSFDPRTKCCTYEPRIPNFMVGRILADDSAENRAGRASVLARIEKRIDVSPLGLVGSARLRLLYEAHHGLGRAPDLKCPHFVDTESGGGCGIWAHRPVVCATWFCKHDRGAVGQQFWARLKDVLCAIEMDVSIWCASEVGVDPAEVFRLESELTDQLGRADLGGDADLGRHRRIWGDWTGRELAYYEACAALVSDLDWERVAAICGPRIRVVQELLRAAYGRLRSTEIPERLKLGTFEVHGAQNRKLRVVTYSLHDPQLMSEELASVLPYFSGQPWTEAVANIHASLGIKVSAELLRRLIDFQLLVESNDSDPG